MQQGKTRASGSQSQWVVAQRRIILRPPDDHPIWKSHAQAPTVLPISDDSWIVYFAGRDSANTSRIFAAEIDPKSMMVRKIFDEPVLDIGPEGAFDEHGVGPGTAVRRGNRILMYYSGVKRRSDVPYQVCIGLAISEDGGRTFTRAGPDPVLGISTQNPHGAPTATVVCDDDKWSMWYSSIRGWKIVNGQQDPVYDLRRADSSDGLVWHPESTPTLGYDSSVDGGLVRGNFFDTQNGPRLIAAERGWHSFRAGEGSGYHFIIAGLMDGKRWERLDEPIVFDPPHGPNDWDSDMQCYPWLVQSNSRIYVFYNGNDFGRFGFGVAELQEVRS